MYVGISGVYVDGIYLCAFAGWSVFSGFCGLLLVHVFTAIDCETIELHLKYMRMKDL